MIDTLTNGVVYTGKPIRIPTALKEGKTGMGRVDTFYKASDSQTAYNSAAKDAGDYGVIFDIKRGDELYEDNADGRNIDRQKSRLFRK